jgi:hypothetical protein
MKFVDSIFSLVLYIYKKIDGRGQTTRELIEKKEVVYYTETGYPERRELVKRRTSALPLGTTAHAGDVGCL